MAVGFKVKFYWDHIGQGDFYIHSFPQCVTNDGENFGFLDSAFFRCSRSVAPIYV